MTKLKALLLFGLLAAFVFSLAGCGMLATESADPEVEEAEVLKGLPEWLLLAHRDIDDLAAEEEDLFLPKEEEAEAEEEAEEPEPAPETATPDPAPAQQQAPASPPADDGSDAEVEESGGLTKSQQMLAESWERQRAESNDDDEEDGSWWDPEKKDFSHDFWER